MKMTLLELNGVIKEITGRDFFDEDVCNDIVDLDSMVGSVRYELENDEIYVEFDVENIDCGNLLSEENIIEIKEVQTPQKRVVFDKKTDEWGRVIISYIPEFGWYELDMDNEPLQYFETFEEAKGDIE